MDLPPLVPARLVGRRRRFFADVAFDDGTVAVAHLPNTGRMTSCLRTDGPTPAWLSRADAPTRRLAWTVELTRPHAVDVLVNPLRANRVVGEALPRLFPGHTLARAEARSGAHRFDHHLVGPAGEIWVEVKCATWVRDGVATFPDAVSARATAHLEALVALVAAGARATLVVLVARGDAERFAPADDVDPVWGRALRAAVLAGVGLQVWRADVSPAALRLDVALPVELG